MKITRRKWAAALAAPAAIAGGQTAAPEGADAELKAARDRLRAAAEALAQEDVPMATEPAFQFKA